MKKLDDRTENKTTLDKQSKIMLFILSLGVIVLIAFIFYYGITSIPSNSELLSNFEVVAPDFTNLEARPSAVNDTEKTEGTIGFDAYYELRRKETRNGLDNLRGLIGDKLYVQYLNGLDSDYYKKAVEYDYAELLSTMDEMLKEAGLMEGLYNTYDIDYEMPEYTKCHQDECSLLKFITDYTKDDLYTYLKDRHDMWESVLEVEKSRTEVSDSYLNLFYQDEVCENKDYINKIQIETLLLTKEQYELGLTVLQDAYDKGDLETKIFDETNKNYFKTLPLYKDIDYYDGTFKDLTIDTFNSKFASDVLNSSIHLMGGEDVATVSNANEALINKLKEIEPPKENEDIKDYTKLENWNMETLSLANRNEDDILYLLWKIVPGSCEHTLKIPSKSSILTELEDKAKLYLADRTISDTIYAELNNLTTSEVMDLLKSNYGYTDEELGNLSEEELLEDLRELEERDANKESQNVQDIRTHMINDGYDKDEINALSDSDVIELFNKGHGNE